MRDIPLWLIIAEYFYPQEEPREDIVVPILGINPTAEIRREMPYFIYDEVGNSQVFKDLAHQMEVPIDDASVGPEFDQIECYPVKAFGHPHLFENPSIIRVTSGPDFSWFTIKLPPEYYRAVPQLTDYEIILKMTGGSTIRAITNLLTSPQIPAARRLYGFHPIIEEHLDYDFEPTQIHHSIILPSF